MSDKKVSKIPKLSPTRRPSPLSELHLKKSVSSSFKKPINPNQPRIFETKNLNSTCSFLKQLKTKLKKDVDGHSEDESSEKVAMKKISGIVSSILSTLNDVSDDLPSSYNPENKKEITGEMVKVNKTSSLLSDSGKCYYMAQQFTVSHLHESEIDNNPVIDVQFLQQLTNLQVLLQETINKIEDKSTLTQDGKFNDRALKKSFKNRGLASLVQIDHESKPPKDILLQKISKENSSKSEEITNNSILKKYNLVNLSSSGTTTTPDLSDYDDYPPEYKCCIHEDEEDLKKYTKQLERILPPPQSFSNFQPSKKTSSKDLKSPTKLSPKNSLGLKTSSPTRNLSLKSDSFKGLDESKDKLKEKSKKEIKNQDKNENNLDHENKDVNEKKKDKKNVKETKDKNESRTSSIWAFKSLKRSCDSPQQQKKVVDQKKSIPEDLKKKKEKLVKDKESDKKSNKEKSKKDQSKGDLGRKDEKLSKKRTSSANSGDLSKKSSNKAVRISEISSTVIESNDKDDDILIPPPPLFGHDSYIDVQPYKDDSFLSLFKLPGNLDKLRINTPQELKNQELQHNFTPEKKKSNVQFMTPGDYGNIPFLIDDFTSTVGSFTSNAIQTTGSQLLMNSRSIQDNYISFYSHQSTGSNNIFVPSVDQGINSNVVQVHYSVQAPPAFEDFQVSRESISTDAPGNSLEKINIESRSVSVVLPKTQSQVVQAAYETPVFLMPLKIETTNEATSTDPKLPGEGQSLSAKSSKQSIPKKVSLKTIDPNIAKLRCSNCMCTEGGPSIEKKQSDKGKKLEEVEIFDKDSPQRYFNQVLHEIDMMKNCIEFAMDNQLSIHDKLKAYLDDGRIVKSKYPHFHTLIDGIPVILIWNDDPQSLANHLHMKQLDKKQSDKKTLPKKLSSTKSKKFTPSSTEKTSSNVGDNTFFERKRNILRTKILLDHLANTVAKCTKIRKKEKFKCDECGARCPDRFDPVASSTCKITTSNSKIGVKSSRLNFRKKEVKVVVPPVQDSDQKKKSIFINPNSGVRGCRCDSEISHSDNASSPVKPITKTNSSPKCKAKKRCPFKHLSSDDDSEKLKHHPPLKRFEKHESTNIPSKTEAKSIQTYYLTPRSPQKKLKKSPQSSISDDSVNDIPYLIDAKSLPQFEHPETVCSSKLFDVKQVDCELRDDIKTENKVVKDTLLRINLNALLDSFRPAKCCQKTVLNGRSRGMYPYPASLQSLPLSQEDLDRILQIIQSNKSKRFDTTKRLYESDKFNSFQTANDPIINPETTRTLVYFFELFKKPECKTSLATTSSSSSSSSRTIIRPTPVRHDLKIFEFIKKIYNNHPISDNKVLKNKKDSTKTLYRHRSKHKRHHHHHHHQHHYKRRVQRSTSTSMDKISKSSRASNKTSRTSKKSNTCSKTTSVMSFASNSKPSRNISFLLIPKSELNNYFCGDLSSMYSPSLNSLPFDDSDLKIVESQIQKDLNMINEEEIEIDDKNQENQKDDSIKIDVEDEIGDDIADYIGDDIRNDIRDDIREDIRDDIHDDIHDEIVDEIGDDIDDDIRDDIGDCSSMKMDYGRTLGAIYETDESEKENFTMDLRKENPCSISEYSLQDLQDSKPISEVTTNLEVLTCKLSTSLNQSKDLLGDIKSSQDFELPSTSSSLSTNFPEIPLQRKSIDSDLSVRKHNIFSSGSLLTNTSSSRIPISCLPLNCTLSKDKPSFLHIPNIINDTKRFLYRQKEELFKPNLDKIIEKTSETTSTLSSSLPRRRRKSLKRSHCALSLKSSVSRMERETSTTDNKPFTFEMIPKDEIKCKKTMKIDKAVVAYDISPSSQFTFLSGDVSKMKNDENKFKSENICVWPVFQHRFTKKRNRAFVVAIHSSAVRIGKKEPNQLGDQPNTHGDFCEICRKKTKLSNDNFLLGYIGEECKIKMENQNNKKERKEKDDGDKASKNVNKTVNNNPMKIIESKIPKPPSNHHQSEKLKNHSKDSFQNNKDNVEKIIIEKRKSSTKKEPSHPVKLKAKVLRRKPSIKILPEVIDIKIPTHVKSTRLKHKFCDKGDRPGYVTVLSTPCNCPDVTIFIPCYCSCCDGKTSRNKTDSNYTMVPIIEKTED